ncbi:GPI ethanolamine phosphate transferase 3 isoform X2 [Cornus florida]|nr:GPI ethanolamine phosphate transferase 3 isoform X2 [Cornus florida]
MMGDDTWLQLFPHHFNGSYPFPSFNVKDLHTVDDGCTKHLLPSLYEEDWDVLIAHFLGVDHAGHIFGVDSTPMVEKLEQYNGVLEKVIEALGSQSGAGGLNENTLLLVMGDHGQTINGDHGGGNAEEVETSIFAMSLKKPPSSVPEELNTSSCRLDLDGRKVCISSIQQLDFAVTVSALLGVPFPFGSIGRIHPELYALVAGTWNLESSYVGNCQNQLNLEEWMQNYVNVLCVNSWQVKRYIDVYSASSVIGFSNEDLLHVSHIYSQAEEDRSRIKKEFVLYDNENCYTSLPSLKRQIDAYFKFLESVADLARSKWTEFDLKMMGAGFCIMLTSLIIHFLAIKKVDKLLEAYVPSHGHSRISFWSFFAYIVVAMRAVSFLSNSYILEEGKVASFLLATSGMLNVRYSIMKKKMLLEAMVFVLLISILRFTIELGLSKQAVSTVLSNICPYWMLGIAKDGSIWIYIAEIVPTLALILLAYMLYKSIVCSSCRGILKYVIIGTIFCYILIAVNWALESNILSLSLVLEGVKKNFIPRIIYGIGFAQLSSLALGQLISEAKDSDSEERIAIKAVAMLSAWSSTIIIVSGKQGPLVALASIAGGWCIMRLVRMEQDTKNPNVGILNLLSFPVTQWSLGAVCLFFCTGHWCAFDGLRYAAAFIGFDEFIIVPQAILLTIDTFGFSHILPIFGLPFLVACRYPFSRSERIKGFYVMQLCQVYLIYGLIMATTATFTILCVTIQRRHLMVWGLFAPKFVFDVVGLILTDILICLASLYYFGRPEVESLKSMNSSK